MKIKSLSPTRLESIRLCEARADAKANDSEYEEEQGEGARSGSLAHDAAKLWYRPVSHTFTPDGYVDQVQYSFINPDDAFKAAIHECGEKKDRDGKPRSDLPQTSSGLEEARSHFDNIIAFYNRDKLKVIFAERKYEGMLAQAVPVSLIIDLAVDNGNGVMEIIDFKTGFIACSTEEMWDKDQVLMNLLAISRDPVFQQYRTKQFKYYWTRKQHETGPIMMSPERLSDYENWLYQEFNRIQAITEPVESINKFCKSCGRRFVCGKFSVFMAEAFGLTTPMTEEQMKSQSLGEIMAQYDKLKGQMDAVEASRSFLGNIIRGAMEQGKVTKVKDGGFSATLRSNKREEYDTQTFVNLCNQGGLNPVPYLGVGKKDVEQVFGSNPAAMQQLMAKMNRGSTAPFIVVTAEKKKK